VDGAVSFGVDSFKAGFLGPAGLVRKRSGHRAACMHRKRLTMDLCAGISRDSRWRFRRPLSRLRPAADGLRVLPGKTASEEKPPSSRTGGPTACHGSLFYEFTVNGEEVFCREGYTDAEGLLAHLENVGSPGGGIKRSTARNDAA